jgi:hypothetical protein
MDVTQEILDYLHDALLHGVQFDLATEERNLVFIATYHEDCGLATVAGKTVELTAKDITLFHSRVFGAVCGLETIDSCNLSVSDMVATELAEFLRMGGRVPKARLSISTHSGSAWEIMCESLSLQTL